MKKGPFKMKGPSGLKLKKSPAKHRLSYGEYDSAERKKEVKDHNAIHRGKVPGTETRTIYPKKKKEK
jgi:hypothetical protein